MKYKDLPKEKQEELEKMLSDINKKLGNDAVMRLGERSYAPVDVVSTGSLALDFALGVGGIPKGRVTEIFGPEASGKTTLCQHIVAEAQKAGGIAAFVDMEHALDMHYAERCGVDVQNLLIAQPDSGEKALETTEALVRSGIVDVIAIDSVAALVPKAELEGDMGDSPMGMQARLMSQAMRKLSGAIKITNTAVVFTNQLRHKIGVMFGNPETTPGGLALKFYSSVRLDIRRIKTLRKNNDEIIGTRVRVRIIKNKVAPPFRQAEFDILYNHGISKIGEIIDLGTKQKIIDKRGAYYYYNDERIGHGRNNTYNFLRDHLGITRTIEDAIRTKLKDEFLLDYNLESDDEDTHTEE